MVPLPRPPRERRLCDEPSDHATEPLVVHVFTESVGAVLPVDSWMVDSGGFRLHAPVAQLWPVTDERCGPRRAEAMVIYVDISCTVYRD